MLARFAGICDPVTVAKLSLMQHALEIARRMEKREIGNRCYFPSSQNADGRRMAAIAEAFDIDADPLFIDGFTAWSVYSELLTKVVS
jgi:hypothetical protein